MAPVRNVDLHSADSDGQPKASHVARWSWLLLAGPVFLFIVLRVPALVHQPGMQDEQWFAVPGLTVWQEGIPRIPYLPTRQRDTLFENADVCLMALPPGLFYVQAPFFAVLPAGYATARTPLFLAALFTIALAFRITGWLGGGPVAAGFTALTVALSRPLLFTGLTVRPDLLCIVCGWLTILVLWRLFHSGQLRYSLIAGGWCGLAALFHPFALVFAIQSGVALLFAPGNWKRRVAHLANFGAGTLIVLSLWLPLIYAFPYEFRSQFFANVLDRAGPGLPARLLWPIPSMVHHARLLWEFAGPWQCLLMGLALVVGSIGLWRIRRDRIALAYLALVWSSIFLTATVAGLHPTKGYWIYPFVWLIPMLAITVENGWQLRDNANVGARRGWGARAACMFVVVAMALPGAGLRTTWLYWTHWRDPTVHGPAFIQGVLDELPHDGVFYADLSYVFDIYLSGRETRLCQERVQYWGDGELSYDYLLLSWEGEDAGWADQYEAVHLRRVGDRRPIQNCFVDIYRSTQSID